ncbi:MAG: hypothetical protein GPJ54_07880, partial [Candidatus Heimdallarchaeota archaeon]|nr:hypothetical protein [Candidatus Heimdallarchaeota archaeon]
VSSDKDNGSFDTWRPSSTSGGCHNFGSPNTGVTGEILFTPAIMYVTPGEVFDISATVSNFGGAISSNDLTIGYNTIDGDNSDFLVATVSEPAHAMTGDDSTAAYVETFTAPATTGTYIIHAYAVSGTTNYWDWVEGQVVVFVNDGTMINSDYTQDVIDTLAAVAEPAAGGLQWPETNKTGSVYKSGMIKGMASIGDYMLDVYEERSRSSLFTGLNTEETALPLELAIGAGNWLLGRAQTNASGTYWYEVYNQDGTPSGTLVSTPYYGGVAGIVSYLLRLYRITHDPLYLDAAKGGADWLIAVADTTTGYAWPESYGSTLLSTRWSKGGPGIGSVFLEMYRFTEDVQYLNVAKGLFTWLDSEKLDLAGDAYWLQLPDVASEIFLGRWHGVAGIASFLIDLYEVTGAAAHKALALSAVDYVQAQAIADGTGVKFENQVAEGTFFSGWSRGGAGIGSVLLRANTLDSGAGYLATIDLIYNYYTEISNTTANGIIFSDSESNPRNMTGMGHGGPGIGMFLVQAYEATGDVKFKNMAQSIALGLNDLMFTNTNGVAWLKSDAAAENYIDYYLYYGIVGVATFMQALELMQDPADKAMAVAATTYLLDIAEVDGTGLKWLETESATYKTGTLKGASGNILELLNMYSRQTTALHFGGLTTNTTFGYLEAAVKGGNWLDAVAVTLDGGKAWYERYDAVNVNTSNAIDMDFYGGAAGIGETLLKLSQASGDQSFLDLAKAAGTFFIATADTTEGYAWPELYADVGDPLLLSTRWSKGTPGVGTFFLNLYVQTGDTTYLDVASGVGDFLISTGVADSDGLKWYRLANVDTSGTYLGRWHGSAGIASFFMDLALAGNNYIYMNAAIDALKYLDAKATIVLGEYSWVNEASGTEYLSGWSRGGAGIGATYLRAYLLTGENNYLTTVDGVFKWYEGNVTAVTTGWAWADSTSNLRIATSLGHGSAGIIMFATEAFQKIKHTAAYGLITQATAYLEDIANITSTSAGDEANWNKSTNEAYIESTMYYGTSGVAFAFLETSAVDIYMPRINTELVTFGPDVSYTVSDIVANVVTVSITATDDVGISTYEMKTGTGAYSAITLTSGAYALNVSAFAVGDTVVTIKVTDNEGNYVEFSFTVTIPEPVTTTTTTTTTTTSTPTTSTTTTTTPTTTSSTKKDDSDDGFLPISLFVVALALVALPIVARRSRR